MAASDYLIGYLWFVIALEIAGYLIIAIYRKHGNGSGSGLDFTESDIWIGRLFGFGGDGARLRFIPEGSGRTISLRKYVTDTADYHVILEFAASGTTDADIATLRESCSRHALPIEISTDNGEETLYVNCGNDGVKAYNLALEIWTKVFRSSTKRSYRREVSGINIDNPDIGPRTWSFIVLRVGLALAALLSVGAPPDWTAPLGNAALGGSMASLAFFVAFFLSVPIRALLRPQHVLVVSAALRFLNAARVLIWLTLPVAVLLVWAGVGTGQAPIIWTWSDAGTDAVAEATVAAATKPAAISQEPKVISAPFATWLLWAALAFNAALMLAAGIGTWRESKRNDETAIPEIERWLDDLLFRSDNGIYMLIAETGSNRFIRIHKYIRDQRDEGLALVFPQIGDVDGMSRTLESYCEEHGIGPSTISLADTGQTRCFLVDCGRDREHAAELARRIWTDFYGLTAKTGFDRSMGHAGEVAPIDPAPLRIAKRRNRNSNIAFATFFLSMIALPVATLNSIGGEPDWTAVGASGSIASLGFFVLYLITFVATVKHAWNSEDTESNIPLDEFFGTGLLVLLLALPIAVILFWYGV